MFVRRSGTDRVHEVEGSGRLLKGVLAGAVGTLALNAATYADMVVRGRPVSTVPDDSVRRSAERLGIDALLGTDDAASHRRQALGALGGYAVGTTVGALYGLLRPRRARSALAETVALAGAAMVVGNAGAVATQATDPRRWTFTDWMADIIPHLCYGIAAVGSWRVVGDREHR